MAYSIVFQITVGIITAIYAFLNGFRIPDLVPIFPNLVLMTFLYGAGNVFVFNALKLTEASQFTILFASRSLWTIFAAILFLGESFSLKQVIGTILIISSIVIVSWRKQQFKLSKGELYAILAALAFGLAFANDAFIIRNFDVSSYLVLAFIIPALGVWAVYPKSISKMKPLFEKKTLPKLIVLAVFYTISAIVIFLAYQVGRNAAQIAPLNQTTIIITVIFAVIFLNEKTDILRKLVGAAVSLIGVILLK